MLKLKIEDGVYHISLHKIDRLNTMIAEALQDELIKIVSKPGREVLLSLEGINFINSSGFEAILAAVNRASEIGSKFRISDVSPDVYELLKLRRFKFTFELDPVKAKAIFPVV